MVKVSKRTVLIFALLVVGASFFFGRDLFSSNQQEFAVAQAENYQEIIISTGNIESREDLTVIAEEQGTVRAINYLPGDTVRSGEIVVQLANKALEEELAVQQSLFRREQEKLTGLTTGPEDNERDRIVANNKVAEQALENALNAAIASSQSTGVQLENLIRQSVDKLFKRQSSHLYFSGVTSANNEARINTIREELEKIFEMWHTFALKREISRNTALEELEIFGRQLHQVHEMIFGIYSIFINDRFNSEENAQIFQTLSTVRTEVFNAIVSNTQNINAIKTQAAQLELSLAQTRESLAGGTNVARNTQRSLVEAEASRLGALEVRREKTVIRAPFDGVVGEVLVNVGEFVPQGTRVFRFVSDDAYEIKVDVTEVEIPTLSVGQTMRAYIDALNKEVDVVVRTIDVTEKKINNVPVYTVILDVLGQDRTIRSGMTIDVKIPTSDFEERIAVPQAAVLSERSGTSVTVRRGGKELVVPVTIVGSNIDGFVGVEGEVNAGDEVLISNDD